MRHTFFTRFGPSVTCLFITLIALFVASTSVARAGDGAKESRVNTYRLQPMDLVKVQIFQEPDLDREVRVSKDRAIVLPLIGRVDVGNRSLRDVEQFVTDLYQKDYLVNPQVNLTVIEYSPRTVNVFGAVNSPGAIVIPPEKELSLVDAIARAGGFSRLASRGHVSLTRTLPNGETENYAVNVDQLMSGEGAQRWTVQNGDALFVPERVL